MFKVGDKVVCRYIGSTSLKRFKTYTISAIIYDKLTNKITHIRLVDRNNNDYKVSRFITLSEHRKLKLESLCLK